MIRLYQVCLVVFLATVGFYLYQLHEDKDYTFAFLMMGASGCLYLLMRTEQRYTKLTQRRAPPTRPQDYGNKRIAPQCVAVGQLAERRVMPSLTRSQEQRTPMMSGK